MIVKISDYDGESRFVEYVVSGLSSGQMEFLNDNLDEETAIDGDNLKITMHFSHELYPFQSEIAKLRIDDFIAREEIELNIFLSGFLEDMQ